MLDAAISDYPARHVPARLLTFILANKALERVDLYRAFDSTQWPNEESHLPGALPWLPHRKGHLGAPLPEVHLFGQELVLARERCCICLDSPLVPCFYDSNNSWSNSNT